MRYQKRKTPQINSSSMADIAFLLLIFFLITSSFDSMTGIYRKMPPFQADEVLKKKQNIEKRNLLSIIIDKNNTIMYENQVLTISELKDVCKMFISNPDDLDFLPQKELVELEETGTFPVSRKHNISIEISRKANYQTYIMVLNAIISVYNELRDETAYSIFQQSFSSLTQVRQSAILEIYPQHISEKELEEEEGGVQ
jgi:biopolymer transport protein ExbD